MSMHRFLTDNIEGIVKPVKSYPGCPVEYDFDPDPKLVGELSEWLVNNTDHGVLFSDLIEHHGHERIGFQVMMWYAKHMNATADAFTGSLFRTFISGLLSDYAMSILNDKSDDLISQFASMQKEKANAE